MATGPLNNQPGLAQMLISIAEVRGKAFNLRPVISLLLILKSVVIFFIVKI